jgi:hypothetical protein
MHQLNINLNKIFPKKKEKKEPTNAIVVDEESKYSSTVSPYILSPLT